MPIKSDTARLDWLEKMARQRNGLLLHAETESTGRLGLGLGNPHRTLRDAIDEAMRFDRPSSQGKEVSR